MADLDKVTSAKSGDDVPELVPDWLKALLQKYSESEGRLLGLEPAFGAVAAVEHEEENPELAALLAQMGDSAEEPPSDRLATSVEWGPPPAAEPIEPPASIVDDVLLSMQQEEQVPTESPFEETAPASSPPPTADSSAETPAWLAGIDASEPTATEPADEGSDWLAGIAPAPEPAETDEPADWLSEFATDQVPVTPPAAEADEVEPDWLEAVESLPDETPAPPTPPAAETGGEALPDWLSAADDFSGEAPAAPSSMAEAPSGEDVPDWFGSIEGFEGEIPGSSRPGPEVTGAEEEVDWLTALRSSSGQPESPGESPPAIEAQPTDWLADFAPADEEEAAELSGEGDVPDWLAEVSPATEEEIFSPPADSALPDWLVDMEPPPGDLEAREAAASEALEAPDWLTELSPAAEKHPGEPMPAARAAEVSPEPEPPSAQPEAPETEVEVPDWMKATRPTERPGEAGVADWLAAFAPAEPAEPVEPTEAASEVEAAAPVEAQEIEAEAPDWLAAFAPVAPAEPTGPPVTTEGGAAEEELPDWLADLRATGPEVEAVSGASIEAQVFEARDAGQPDTITSPQPAIEEETPGVLAETDAPGAGSIPPETEPSAPTEIAGERDLPDWLARYQTFDPESPPLLETPLEDEADLPGVEPEGDLPEWLRRHLTFDPESPPLLETPLEEEADLETAEARRAQVETAPAAPAEPEVQAAPAAPAEAEAALPDWLQDLQAAEVEPPSLEAMGAEAEPDLAAEAGLETEVAPLAPTEIEGEAPDWLTELRADRAEAPPFEEADVEAEIDFGEDDWPEGDVPPFAPSEVEGEAPDWLTSLRPTAPTESTDLWQTPPPDVMATLAEEIEVGPFEPESFEAELPEPTSEAEVAEDGWLSSMRPPAEETPPLEPQAVEGKLPDWLAALAPTERAAPADLADVTERVEDVTEAGPVPDWLQALAAEAPSAAETEAFDAEHERVESPAEQPPFAEAEAEIPAWLMDIRASAAPELDEAPAPEIETEIPRRPSVADVEEAEAEGPVKPPEEVAAETEASVPDWLQELALPEDDEFRPSEASARLREPKDEPAEAEPELPALPAWMADLTPPAGEDQAVIDELVSDEAAIPDWLAGFEPVAEAAPPVEETPPETPEAAAKAVTALGPGLVNILEGVRPTPLAATAGLEPAQSEAVQVFYDIATTAPQPASVPAPASRSQQLANRAGRAALQVLFLVVVALPFLLNRSQPWLPLPNEAVQAVQTELEGVVALQPPDSVALVSFDYTPATEGEMAPLARAVLRKLQGQGLRIIAVSLEPEGPGMAQALLDEVAAEVYGSRALNLGFLPGGAVGVRGLIFDQPLNEAQDFVGEHEKFADLRVQHGWPEINTLDDVSLIVEIGASPKTVRWWVEQLAAETSPPILAVVSAAAEPLVRPYRTSDQLAAVVAGVNGAAALESGRSSDLGDATRMLDSQSLASLFLIVLMMAGTVAGLMSDFDKAT